MEEIAIYILHWDRKVQSIMCIRKKKLSMLYPTSCLENQDHNLNMWYLCRCFYVSYSDFFALNIKINKAIFKGFLLSFIV